MEAVAAVVETTVAATWVDAVAVRRVRRIGLNTVAAHNRKGQQSHGRAGSEQQSQMREGLATAPP
jgi:hypothetical protein